LVWKRTVSNGIYSLATSERLLRMEQDTDFTRFKNVHTDRKSVGGLAARTTIELSNAYFLAKLAACVSQSDLTICSKCLTPFMDTIEHFALSCSATEKVRSKFWASILDIFGIPTYVYLDNWHSSSTEEFLYILLGRVHNLMTNFPDIEHDVNKFIAICAKYLREAARIYFS